VLDLCTGSGCIGISLLKARDDIKNAVLVDISPVALEIARENISRLGVGERCLAVECDIARDFPKGRFDMIVSNPPYIPSADIDTLSDEVKNEPMLALDGGEDGLLFYRHFLAAFTSLLTPTGAFLFEIGWEQGDALRALGAERGFAVEILSDFGGRERVAVLSRKGA
jgi:release factor glutamine methyltransferase